VAWRCLVATVPRDAAHRDEELAAGATCLGTEVRPPGGVPWPVRQPWEDGPDPEPPAVVEVLAWFGADAEPQGLLRALAAEGFPADHLEVRTVREGDWEEGWRHRFQPFALADGLVIAPPWNAPPGALVVEPAMAFGTGDHPTTRAALEAVVRLARPGEACLDVGCGTGILALAAARCGMIAEGIDCDPEAVRAARGNGVANDLPCRFDSRPLGSLAGRYALVVANLFAETHRRLATDLVRLTDRHLVLAGVLEDRLPSLLGGPFAPLALSGIRRDGEWALLEWVRP